VENVRECGETFIKVQKISLPSEKNLNQLSNRSTIQNQIKKYRKKISKSFHNLFKENKRKVENLPHRDQVQ
jgi:hypothetical protein